MRANRRPVVKLPKPESRLEAQLALQIRVAGFPVPEREYKGAISGRKFRLDFAYPTKLLAVEVQGAVHRIKGSFDADLERQALLLLAGWRVLCVGRKQIGNGDAIAWLGELLRK